MKKVREKDIKILEGFCIVTALSAGALCILFLFDVLQNHWFLNFILGLGVLLHISLSLLFLLRQKRIMMVFATIFIVFYIASLVYFNI